MISPFSLDALKLLLKFKHRGELRCDDPGAETTQILPNALQLIPVINRADSPNYLTHIMLLNCLLCSPAEVKDSFFI